MHTGQKVATFRQRFSELIEESGLTDSEFGNIVGASQQSVSAWKRGTRSPKKPAIIAIATSMGISISWLMGFDCEKRDTSTVIAYENAQEALKIILSEDELELLDLYNKADPVFQVEAKDMLKRHPKKENRNAEMPILPQGITG